LTTILSHDQFLNGAVKGVVGFLVFPRLWRGKTNLNQRHLPTAYKIMDNFFSQIRVNYPKKNLIRKNLMLNDRTNALRSNVISISIIIYRITINNY